MANHRIFVSLETKPHLVLFGYDPQSKKVIKYVDSQSYYSPLPYPSMAVDADGDLRMSFTSANTRDVPVRYKLFWDEDSNWFGYQDITVHRTVQESSDEPVYEYAYEPEIPDNSGAAAVNAGGQPEELYYESVDVVGS